MERSIKDRAVFAAAKVSQKNIIFKPLAYFGLGIFFIFYHIISYFKYNQLKYLAVSLVVIFFFINTSFSSVDDYGSDVYLTSSDSIESQEETDNQDESIQVVLIDDYDNEIVSGNLISEEFEKTLESTENIDTFTLEDFLTDVELDENISSNQETSAFDKNSWNLILVNKTHPVPDDYEMELATIKGNMKCDARVLDILTSMLDGAAKDKVNLIVCSPYRDYQLQEVLFNRRVDQYVEKGYSYLDAYRLTSTKVIVPGASEHQLGLAFDIVTDYHAVLDYEFGDTNAGQWLKKHCAEYGFILRYPRGKESITGIEYEPWHFRYVGVEAATYIMENELTLEEFIEGLD